MSYVRCVNNKAYVRVPDEAGNGPLGDLTLGAVYKALPTLQPERDAGLLRIIAIPGKTISTQPTTFNPLTRLPTGSLGTLPSPCTWTHAPKPFYAPRPSRRIPLWALWCGNGSRNAWNSKADGRRHGKGSPPAPAPELCRRQEEVKSSHPLQCLVVSEL